jgi:ubiquinone/menaquinone biosynthesis C-methylase UbiE
MTPLDGMSRASSLSGRWLLVAGLAIAICVSSREAGADNHAAAGGAAPGPSSGARQPSSAHDTAHPPIDCPLRRAGIDPSRLRPFEDVEKYIAFLDRADRAAWQKPDAVVAALGLRGGETVVDLGAGSGYFTFRLAKALPHGKVIAADTEAEMVRHIHHKAMADGAANVEPVLIQPADPQIPGEADLVFACDVLHHVADRAAWLGKLVTEMKAGSQLVLIEFKEGQLPEGPPESAKITRAQVLELATRAGLRLDSERPDLLPYQTFLVFRKPC